MPRLSSLTSTQVDEKARPLLDGVKRKLGLVPNLMGTLAHSPAALEGYLSFSAALAKGALPARLREQIALAVGEANDCQYCLAAHTALGRSAGLTEDEIAQSRRGSSTDPKADAALTFARTVVIKRGGVTDGDVEALRNAGFSDAEIVEVVANVALNIFTNYFNHVAQTEVDFPAVQPVEAKPACAC